LSTSTVQVQVCWSLSWLRDKHRPNCTSGIQVDLGYVAMLASVQVQVQLH